MEPSKIAWSHSSLKAYEDCPHKYYREKVTKEVKFVETDAIKLGNDVHSAIELGVLSNTKPPSALVSQFPEIPKLIEWARTLPNVKVERQLAFTSDLTPVAWFGRGVWARCKIDVSATFGEGVGMAIDWKTGKFWGKDGQAELTALAMFWDNPELTEIHTVWYYMKGDTKKVPDSFKRSDMPRLMERPTKVLQDISRSYKTEVWRKTPGKACRFCDVLDCEFRGRNL